MCQIFITDLLTAAHLLKSEGSRETLTGRHCWFPCALVFLLFSGFGGHGSVTVRGLLRGWEVGWVRQSSGLADATDL